MSGHHQRDQSPRRRSDRKVSTYETIPRGSSWDAFDAPEQTDDSHEDRSQACIAAIYDLTTGARYEGSTRNQHGHAEMDALTQLLGEVKPKKLQALLADGNVEVLCEGKPCCAKCSIFLGLLGVKARVGTKKTKDIMGISYMLNPELRSFIHDSLGYSQQTIEAVCGRTAHWMAQDLRRY